MVTNEVSFVKDNTEPFDVMNGVGWPVLNYNVVGCKDDVVQVEGFARGLSFGTVVDQPSYSRVGFEMSRGDVSF